jgi:outer membrane protein
MKTNWVPGILAFLCLAGSLTAQTLLTAEDAMNIALRKNFSLSLAQYQTSEATVNRQSAIGSFLPAVSASVVSEGSTSDSTHAFSSTTVGTRPFTTVNANLNWQLFNGFQSYNAYQSLKSTETATELQERLTVEATLESVLSGYYNVVLQKQLLVAIRELLGVAEANAELAEAKTSVGAGSKLDELTAIATLNSDSSSLLTQENALTQSKVQLNQLLARDPAMEFEVSDSIPLDSALPVENWKALLEDNNASILQAKAQQDAAASNLRQAKGMWLPSLSAGLGYTSVPSALNSNSSLDGVYSHNGLNLSGTYNVTLSIPIFDQLQTHQAVSIARLQLRSGETQFQSTLETINTEFEQELQNYESGLQQVALEERDLVVVQQQADAAQEQYKVGTITALDLRTADQLLLSAKSQLFTAYQTTKQAEITLKGLAGFLVKTPEQSASK